MAGFLSLAFDSRLSRGWEESWNEQRDRVAEELGLEFDTLVARGDLSASRIAGMASLGLARDALQDSLGALLEETGVTATTVFGSDGQLIAWAGSHHGRVPEEVTDGSRQYAFAGTPLFSYLYFAAPIAGDGGTAAVASLMHSELPELFASGLDDFASSFQERTGERIRIAPSERLSGSSVFDLGWPGEPLLSIAIEEPDRLARRTAQRARWARFILVVFVLAWLLLSFGAPPEEMRHSAIVLLLAAAVVPLEWLPMPADMRAPAAFLTPGPLPLTLGRVLLLCSAATPALAVAARWRWPDSRYFAPAVAAVSFPSVLLWFATGASEEILGTTDTRWIVFQACVTLVLTLMTVATLAYGRRARSAVAAGPVLSGLVLAALLSFGVALWVRFDPHPPVIFAAFWALPVLLAARGLTGQPAGSATSWFCAFWLAATAVLPFAWAVRTEARMSIAEREIGRLGVVTEPFLSFLLDRFADQVGSLHEGGLRGSELLYRSWTSSGLADHRSSVFLTLWSADGFPEQELKLGVKGDRPAVVDELLPELQTFDAGVHRDLLELDVRHLVAVPLPADRLLTAAIPPKRSISDRTGPNPLLAALQLDRDEEFLTLVSISQPPPSLPAGQVLWSRNEEGWRAASTVRYPDGPYSVSYTISIPNLSVMTARATLVLAITLTLLALLWPVSAWLLRGRLPVPIHWRSLFKSFRARVTWTLFSFFLMSSVIFGTLAYRTLLGASERTATALAERVVAEIAGAYAEEGGSLEQLARRAGADLLEYRAGELVGGSVEELIDLGLYDSWVDPEIYALLEGGQTVGASKVVALGDWRYVLAHRRLPDGDIVASPVPLRAGAAALRRRDVADLLAFAIVMGPVISLVLALLVGRALTRPIETLRIASERVGSGNLAVHLPDDRVDEFGSVFAAFNRMVLRLGDTRRELLQTTRRTTAIVEEAATGVIAVDPRGRVRVANPQAEMLLAVRLAEGNEVPRSNSHAAEVGDWLDLYLASGMDEDDADFKWRERRVRGRARRIIQDGREGGVVVILEDVTDELRSERILAWGEMAKQVAHEVKNPLTPMKLSVQHLRRAWNDQQRDFGAILERNVATILTEIDRLASIARSFSRLAAPGAAGEGPVVSVNASAVVEEVLELYRSGGPALVRVQGDLEERLPRVMCRAAELKEVLLNLLENARAAMPNGGVVRISARAAQGLVSRVVISVKDEGTGIPEALLPRIFEPRFSTRSRGTGLGLAIVKRMVDSWEGKVEVESRAGTGTRVSISLRSG